MPNSYERDLLARGGDAYNARRARIHAGTLLSKPVALLSTLDMVRWRESLIANGLAADTVNRIRNTLRAALTLAAKRGPRIVNERVWQRDLEALPNATVARNVILPDDVIRKLINAAYTGDHKLGLLVEVIAQTGCRPSQVVRLDASDLDTADQSAPKLWMPRSGKGHPSKRAKKMQERVPVPITEALAALLGEAAKGRAPHDRLLIRIMAKCGASGATTTTAQASAPQTYRATRMRSRVEHSWRSSRRPAETSFRSPAKGDGDGEEAGSASARAEKESRAELAARPLTRRMGAAARSLHAEQGRYRLPLPRRP
jgi:integrase